jgi:hypothetical protein
MQKTINVRAIRENNQRASMDGMEAMQKRKQLRWVGHVQRRSDNRMPKQISEKR